MGDRTLSEIFLGNAFRECHKWSHYLSVYEKHLSVYRGKAPVVLEIGVREGGSLGLWREYFGPEATIIGIDIKQSCEILSRDGFEIYIGDQSDLAFLEMVLDRHSAIDVVIDDGSHVATDMIKSFEFLYPRIKKKAVYIVEDIVPSIAKANASDSPSFLDYASRLLLQINLGFAEGSMVQKANQYVADAVAESGKNRSIVSIASSAGLGSATEFTASTESISFYPNMVVFEKTPQSARSAIKSSGMNARQFMMYSTYKLQDRV